MEPATATGNYAYDSKFCRGDRFVMVGDAFCFVDPMFSTGVYLAMNSAFEASKAVDAGVLIPTVNDDFTGRAPDLGALEVGKPEPKYGPRWLKGQPFYR